MPKVSEMFPSRFMKHDDLNGKSYTLLIARVIQEDMYSKKDQAIKKGWVVYFEKARKGLILNVTLANQITEIAAGKKFYIPFGDGNFLKFDGNGTLTLDLGSEIKSTTHATVRPDITAKILERYEQEIAADNATRPSPPT